MKIKTLITPLSLLLGVLVTVAVWFAVTKIFDLKDPADEIGDGGFLSGEPCGPPCFLGIIPDVTKESDAVKILQDNGLYQDCSFVNNEPESGLRGFHCSSALVSITFFRGTDLVGGVGFYPVQRLTVEMVIEKYGEPDAVSVRSIWFNWEAQPETSMTLFYNDINATLSLGTQGGNVFNLEPSTPIISVGYSKPGFPSADEDEAFRKYLSLWQGYGEYQDVSNR